MRASVVAGATALLLAIPSVAMAQSRYEQPSWRRGTSQTPEGGNPLRSFTLEVRFGPYYPEIDEELGGKGPYTDFFGTGGQFYFGLELDWTPIRIPYIGRIGPAFGWGYVTMSAKAKVEGSTTTTTDGTTEEGVAGPKTSINIHAMHASAVLRIDEIKRRTVIPIVPYAKLGFGFGTWSSATETGTSKVGDCTDETADSCIKAEGLSIGSHIAVGGMLGLNWLDPRSGAMARETTGIDHAYLFGEWMWMNLDSGAGKNPNGMHIGSSTWIVGLAIDF